MAGLGSGSGSTTSFGRSRSPGTENGFSPFFSPDGNQVAFTINGRSLRVAPLNGGPPVTLTDSLNSAGGDWGQDGYIYIELDEAWAGSAPTGGPIEVLFRLSDAKQEIGAEYPNVMPDGKGIVFRRRLAGQAPNDFEIMEMAVPNGTPHPLIRGRLRPLRRRRVTCWSSPATASSWRCRSTRRSARSPARAWP